MFDWLAGYVDRWANRVSADVRDLVHWAVHALAGVVYAVFGHVGAAWHLVYDYLVHLERSARRFAYDCYDWFDQIITRDLPWLWHTLLSDVRGLADLAGKLYDRALAAVRAAYDIVLHAIERLARWVDTHVYQPLHDLIRGVYRDLLKWGYFAYRLLTDPPKLAALLIDALIAAGERAFWRIAAPAGRFAFGVVLHNAGRFARLVEQIVTAVL